MHNCYRIATKADYECIYRLLICGDEQGVLVRSLFRCEEAPYSLLSISRGPYSLSLDGISGFSIDGKFHTIRITDTDLHNVEMRREGSDDWVAPEFGSIILLIPK